MPIRRGVAGAKIKVRGNLRPPRGSRLTGELLPDGRPVYARRIAVHAKRPKRDADGNILYHVSKDGRAPTRPAYESYVAEWQDVEFVIFDAGNGMTYEVRSFRASPEELAAQEKRRAREAAIEQLGDLAVELQEAKIRPADLIAAIRGESGGGTPLPDDPQSSVPDGSGAGGSEAPEPPAKPAKPDPLVKARAALARKREEAKAQG